jgi:hypothetical protein
MQAFPAASQVRTRAGAGCDKLCKRTDIDANGVAPEGERFYKRRASPHVIVKHQVAGRVNISMADRANE